MPDEDKESDDTSNFLSQPTKNYESFIKYVDHLNAQLKKNMPFLRAKFGVTNITILMALSDGGILTEKLKKKFFDKKLSKTSILVQFTTEKQEDQQRNSGGNDDFDDEENEMINIRKFPSVKTFMKRISGLVSVLQSIEVFSSEIRQLQHETPGGDGDYQVANGDSFNNA